MCSCHAFGPSMRIAIVSSTWSTESAAIRSSSRGRGRRAEAAVPQLVRAGEEGVAPRAVLGAERELLEGVGHQVAGVGASVSSANTTCLHTSTTHR